MSIVQTSNEIPEEVRISRLLSIKDVADIMNVTNVTASKIIKESGYGIILHRRVFILESSFYKYLSEMENRL